MFFVFFFFSSRRRHTRLTCDWSSHVCSSDLSPKIVVTFYEIHFRARPVPLDHRMHGSAPVLRIAILERLAGDDPEMIAHFGDRKSTRLNSSHMSISYAVFCLKKKKKKDKIQT